MEVTALALPVAGAVTLAATPLARRAAHALGLVDRPGALKSQLQPVAYLGGVAVMAGVLSGAFGTARLLVPVLLALALGLVDDAVDVSPRLRLAAEVGIGLVAATLVSVRIPGVAGVVIAVAVVVGLMNAVNLLDGMDGLASGVVVMSAAGFAVLLDGRPQQLALALSGALIGFLVFNRPPASIYLGDAGSYALGAALAMLLLSAWSPGDPWTRSVGALALVAIPVADTSVAVIRRARARRPLFAGDRAHIYDQLVDRGLSRGRTVVLCVSAQTLLAASGVALAATAHWTAAAGSLLLASVFAVLLVYGGFVSAGYARSES